DPERHARGAQGPEIAHSVGRRPHERSRRAGLGLGQADHFAAVVQVVRDARRSAQTAEVDHRAGLGNDEGVLRCRAGAAAAAVPRHLTPPVHGLRLAHRATQRAKLAYRNYRRPSCLEAHKPAWTAVSAVGPSKRCTRMAARLSRLTATMWKIET